jgi:hypothetical protein
MSSTGSPWSLHRARSVGERSADQVAATRGDQRANHLPALGLRKQYSFLTIVGTMCRLACGKDIKAIDTQSSDHGKVAAFIGQKAQVDLRHYVDCRRIVS